MQHLGILFSMPTKNPRLSITVEPKLAAQLRRLAELTGNSQSALIGELLEGSTVVFARVIKVLEAAQEARGAVRGLIAEDLENVQGKLERQLGLALDIVDERDLLDRVERFPFGLPANHTEDEYRAYAAACDLAARRHVVLIERRAGRGSGSPPAPARKSSGKTPVSNRGVRSTTKQDKRRGV